LSSKREAHYSSGLMAGVPVIAGTRVPLWTLIEYLEDGRGLSEFLADHAQVTAAQAHRAIVMGLKAVIERRESLLDLPSGDQDATPPVASPAPPEK
jgi:uncharacterized protein (DUF433 family)